MFKLGLIFSRNLAITSHGHFLPHKTGRSNTSPLFSLIIWQKRNTYKGISPYTSMPSAVEIYNDHIDSMIEQHMNAIKMLIKIKINTTYDEPKAKPYYTKFMFIDEPKAKPYYTKFMFIDEPKAKPHYTKFMFIDEPEAKPENNEIIEPEAKLEYVYPIYDLKEHPKFAKYFNEAFNAEHIVKEVEYNKYIAIAIIRENDRITRKGMIEGKKYSYNECLGIKTLTKEQREYLEKKREARKNKHNKKNKKLN